ncbi:MAG: hypothetical protein KGI06_00920 [Candidatus Micrarchaeota archaeon]|nr:hypothetical protein [Candidatus Micrarchaeota archaeon]
MVETATKKSLIDPEAFAMEASRRLNRLDTGNIVGNREVYTKYKQIIALIEKSAQAYGLADDKAKSEKFWDVAGKMYLDILIGETIRGANSMTSIEEKTETIMKGVKAAKNSNNLTLVANIGYFAKGILTLHKGFAGSADEKLDREVVDALSEIRKLKR